MDMFFEFSITSYPGQLLTGVWVYDGKGFLPGLCSFGLTFAYRMNKIPPSSLLRTHPLEQNSDPDLAIQA